MRSLIFLLLTVIMTSVQIKAMDEKISQTSSNWIVDHIHESSLNSFFFTSHSTSTRTMDNLANRKPGGASPTSVRQPGSKAITSPVSAITDDFSRGAVTALAARIKAMGGDPSAYSTQDSELSYVLPLDPAASNYQFDLKSNLFSLAKAPHALPLKNNNMFLAAGISLGILRVPVAVSGGNVTAYRFGNSRLYTFVDPNVFTGFGEADALENVFNAMLSLKIANKEVYSKNTQAFKVVPLVQTSTIAGARTLPAINYDGKNTRGLIPLGAMKYMNGQDQHEANLVFSSGLTTNIDGSNGTTTNAAATESGFRNFIILVISGAQAVGLTKPSTE